MRGKDEGTKFCVHGHHTSFYPVDLPDWLPDDVVQKMVDRFEHLLLQDLQMALKLKELNCKRTLSVHSYTSMQHSGQWEAPGANSDLMSFDPTP
jgi:hypothetical protein